MKLPLNEITESIDLKITLKYKLGDIDKIQYIELTKKQDAELFLAITEAVSISMSKNMENSISELEYINKKKPTK